MSSASSIRKSPDTSLDEPSEAAASAEGAASTPTASQSQQAPLIPCTIDVNISGASGQVLNDARNELTRIFRSGGMF